MHRRVDEEGGTIELPVAESGNGSAGSPDSAEMPREGESDAAVVQVARSVLLSSEARGIITRIDRLEALADGAVVPVDTKRGQVPQVDGSGARLRLIRTKA